MTDAEAISLGSPDGTVHDLRSILAAGERDFLVRKNGDQVKIADLDGKTVGLYFSASWCGPCRGFTPALVEVYEELKLKSDLEVIFVSGDEDEEAFNGYFAKMPWLAVPFSDSTTRDSLNDLFKVSGIPHLVLLDATGKVLSDDGVGLIRNYGADAYPFTSDRTKELEEEEKKARENQTLSSLLVSPHRNFVISNDGKKVSVSDLEGKTVGLYFSGHSSRSCQAFKPQLIEVYRKLKERGENFEIVMVSLDDDEESFREEFGSMPWLSLPLKDKSCSKLIKYFELETLPTLVIIGPDGKTLNPNVTELIEEHGDQAYPFSPEKLGELAEIEKARLEAQTLESLLVSGELDYVIEKSGTQIPAADLVGKHVLLYFSAQWCPPCRAFLPKLIAAYNEIKAKEPAFELIYVSSDTDEDSFNDYFSAMPWLALPFGDARKASLSRRFKIYGIPSLVALAPTGRTVTTEARDLLELHGPEAFPFTAERVQELEALMEEMVKGWPEKVKSAAHEEHELVLGRREGGYGCDGCEENGRGWSYICDECNFDLHPSCYFAEQGKKGVDGGAVGGGEETGGKEGGVCEGDVCHKA